MSHLLDSNAVISYLNASMPKTGMKMLDVIVDKNPFVSVITKMETLGFNFKSAKEQSITETFINNSTILDIGDDVITKTIEIRKMVKIKLPDAIVAATAIVNELILVTHNTKDFFKIDGLQIIDPFELHHQ